MSGLLPELFTHRIELDDAGGHADVFWPDGDIAESAKLERCVKDVKADDDVDEPWAVCRAALGECKTEDCQCKGCRKIRECRIGKPKPGPCKKGLQGPPQPAVKTKPAKPVVKKLVDDDGIKLRDTFRRKMNQFLVVSRAGDDTAVEKARNDVEAVQNEMQVAFEDRMKRIKNWNVQVGYNKLIGDLSGGQQKAIVSYSNDAYKPINNALRRGKMSAGYLDAARQQEIVGYLDAALDKGRLPEQMAVYRGMQSVKVFGKPPPKIGQMFSDAGFVSTSFDPDIASTFGSKKGAVLCELVLPKGTKGLSLEGSLGIAGEGEFLLPRGTNFKIAQAKMENNVWHIRAELISGKQKKTLKEDVVDVVDDYIETPEDTFKFMWRAEDIRLVNDDLAESDETKLEHFGGESQARECKATRKPGPCKKATGPNAKMKKVKPQEHVLRQLLGDWYSAAAAAKGAASRIGANVWGKLPAEVQNRLGQTWGAAKTVERKVMVGFHKAKQLAMAAAAERGLSDKHVATVGRILATADVISAWTVNMPAAYAATGSAAVAKVASWVPVASLAYIAYSSARNPFAVARAARQIIGAMAHEALEDRHEFDGIDVRLLLQRLVDNDGSDWYLALLSAALDDGRDLEQAIGAADRAFAGQPEAGDGEPLLLEAEGE